MEACPYSLLWCGLSRNIRPRTRDDRAINDIWNSSKISNKAGIHRMTCSLDLLQRVWYINLLSYESFIDSLRILEWITISAKKRRAALRIREKRKYNHKFQTKTWSKIRTRRTLVAKARHTWNTHKQQEHLGKLILQETFKPILTSERDILTHPPVSTYGSETLKFIDKNVSSLYQMFEK